MEIPFNIKGKQKVKESFLFNVRSFTRYNEHNDYFFKFSEYVSSIPVFRSNKLVVTCKYLSMASYNALKLHPVCMKHSHSVPYKG